MSILVVGASGYLGGEVTRQALAAGLATTATYFSSPDDVDGATWRALDVRDREAVAQLVEQLRPSVVVNAAYRQSEWAVTAHGAVNVALASVAVGARLVQVSSDVVFSGEAVRYSETATPDPVSPYGAAKAAAETAVAAIDPSAVIARTSLIVGDRRSVQERRVHALTTGQTEGVLFTDDVRCPVHVADLAAALLELAASSYEGIHHLAGGDAVSRYELGLLIARRDGLDEDALVTGRRADSGIPGPLDVRLDCSMTQSRLRTRLRGAREFLA